MISINDVYKKVEDKWVSRVIMDEVIIMPLCRSEEDLQYIYSVSNDTATRLWQLLDGKHSVRDIQEILKTEYQGKEELIEREVLEFIGDLVEVKLIEKVAVSEKRVNRLQASGFRLQDKKKDYRSPEIAKVKMQPEQAVLSCCIVVSTPKLHSNENNYCFGPLDCPDGCEFANCSGSAQGFQGWS